MRSQSTDRNSLDIALCRSMLHEAISLGFRPPTVETRDRLTSAEAVAALGEAAAMIDGERGTSLAPLVRGLGSCADSATLESLSATFSRLFGHTARGAAPPYETEYGDDTLFQKTQELSDIAGFFRAFGLVLRPERHERIDHISCELEFLAFLARKQAHAIESGDEKMAAETARASRLFLKDHAARFVPSFTRRLVREAPDSFYARLATLCLAFVGDECGRLDARLGPEMLRLRDPVEDSAPMACGRPDGPECGN